MAKAKKTRVKFKTEVRRAKNAKKTLLRLTDTSGNKIEVSGTRDFVAPLTAKFWEMAGQVLIDAAKKSGRSIESVRDEFLKNLAAAAKKAGFEVPATPAAAAPPPAPATPAA